MRLTYTNAKKTKRIQSGGDAVALYHIVYKHEGFDESAQPFLS
jgi:hypothetical protein